MKIYNTLTRTKEELKPLEKEVRMYSCGPTVYNYAHIGNLRTYVFMDILRRVLKYEGYAIKGVMNITDVGHLLSDGDEGEDKMELAAKKQRKTPEEIAAYYTDVFMRDLKKLNIGMPEITAKATDHIPEMISFVSGLIEKGYAYETSDGIYFDISKFPEYGKLSRLNLDDQIAGARVEVNAEKRHPADFALWKHAPKEHIMKWESPWGLGYPGWHIECSAMSKKYLGEVFDLHTGGIDHIPVHHENEIAQSEALAGKKTVNYWMHGEFMLVNNGKMSKKLGNTYTLSDLAKKGYSPMAFRYFCLNAHYRNKLNFTFEAMDAAKTSYERLHALVQSHKNGSSAAADVSDYVKRFNDAVSDDLNIPLGLGILWEMVRDLPKSINVFNAAMKFDDVLGLELGAAIEETVLNVPTEVLEWVEARAAAKKTRDFVLADKLRGDIEAAGFRVLDTRDGSKVEKI